MNKETSVFFKFIAKNPPMACICGGILLLLFSPAYQSFWGAGWVLIIIGVILQFLWLFKDKLF